MPPPRWNPINPVNNQGMFSRNNFLPAYQYQQQPGYFPNTVNFNPGSDMIGMLMNFMKGTFFPRAQPMAPSWMSQFDFERIRAQTSMREKTIGQYNTFNPIPIAGVTSMLGGMGFTDTMGLFIGADGAPTQTGKVISDMFNRFMGPHAGPWSQMGTMQNMIRDVSMGSITGPGSLSRISGGLSNLQSHSVMQNILKGTYRDDFFTQQRGMFGFTDMTEIYRMGRDYQVFQGAPAGDLAKRTQGFGRVIGQAMQTFGTPNKEQALQQLLETTGGSIALTNTGELQTALGKIKEVARAANISMELLTAVLTRGSEIAKQLNMPGIVGTNITLTALSELRLTQGRGAISGTPNQFLTPDVIAGAGGQRRASIMYQDFLQQSMASTNMRTSAGLLGTFMEMGIDSAELRGEIRQGPITGQREQYYRGQIEEQLFTKFTGRGMGRGLARRSAVNAAIDMTSFFVGQGQKEITANMPLANAQAQQNRLLTLALASATGSDRADVVPTIQKALALQKGEAAGIMPAKGAGLTTQEAEELNMYLLERVAPHIYKDKSEAELKVIVGKGIEDWVAPRTTMESRIQARKTADRTIIAERFSERYRDVTTPLGRSIAKLMQGGTFSDIMMAGLPPTTDVYGLIGDEGEVALKNLDARAKAYVKTFGITTRAASIHQAYTNIMGRAPATREEAEDFMATLDATDPSKIKGISEGPALMAVKRDKGIRQLLKQGNLISIQNIRDITGGSVQEALGILKTISPDSFTSVAGQFKAARSQGFTAGDLVAGNLTDQGLSIDVINADPRVKALMARIGIEFFPGGKIGSLEELLERAEENGDEGVIRDAIALTGIGLKKREEKEIEDAEKGFREVAEAAEKGRRQDIEMLKNRAALQPGGIMAGADILIKEREKEGRGAGRGGLKPSGMMAEYLGKEGLFGDIDTSGVDMGLLGDEAALFGLPAAVMRAAGRGEISVESERQLIEFVAKFKAGDPKLAERKFEPGMLARVREPKKRLAEERREMLLKGLSFTDQLGILEEGVGEDAIRGILGEKRLKGIQNVQDAVYEVQESVRKEIASAAPITAAMMEKAAKFQSMLTKGIAALKTMFGELAKEEKLRVEHAGGT